MLVERRANVHASCRDDAHVLPTNQEPFDGSFPHNCLTGPVNEEMRSFFCSVMCFLLPLPLGQSLCLPVHPGPCNTAILNCADPVVVSLAVC